MKQNIDRGISRRNPKGVWTRWHKAVFAAVTCVAVVAAFALIAPKIAMGADDKGITTHIPGQCGVRIAHVDQSGLPTLQYQPWTISDETRTVYASGNVHVGRVYIPAGTYYFNSGSYSQMGIVGTGLCDGVDISFTFMRTMP